MDQSLISKRSPFRRREGLVGCRVRGREVTCVMYCRWTDANGLSIPCCDSPHRGTDCSEVDSTGATRPRQQSLPQDYQSVVLPVRAKVDVPTSGSKQSPIFCLVPENVKITGEIQAPSSNLRNLVRNRQRDAHLRRHLLFEALGLCVRWPFVCEIVDYGNTRKEGKPHTTLLADAHHTQIKV